MGNPRLHSCIVLMDTRSKAAANAIYNAMEDNNNEIEEAIAVPDPEQKHIFWFHNELGKLLGGTSLTEVLRTLYNGRDAVWDINDILPFLPPASSPDSLSSLGENSKWWELEYCQLLSGTAQVAFHEILIVNIQRNNLR